MAEILGLVSGSISVVAFAGQLTKSATFLHNFISDIKGAPKELLTISEEIKILQSIFATIQSSTPTQSLSLVQALKHSEDRLNALQDFVKKLGLGKPKLWNYFKVAVKQADLHKYLQDLERSKSMLLQACNNLTRDEQTKSSTQLASIQQSVSLLSTEQQDFKSSVTTVQSTVEDISNTAANLALRSIEIIDVTTETRTDTARVLELTKKIETATHTLVQESINKQDRYSPHALAALRDAADRAIKKTLKRELNRHLRSQKAVQGPLEIADSYPQSTPEIPLRDANDQGTNLSPSAIGPQRQWMTRWRKESLTCAYSKEITIPYFGAVTIQSRTTSYALKKDDAADCDAAKKQVSTTTVSFLPSPNSWLISRGATLTHETTEFFGNTRRNSPAQWKLRTVNIIPGDSEIFLACERQDLGTVLRLFDQGLASPYDVDDDDGRNLLGWVGNEAQHVKKKGNLDEGRLSNLQSLLLLLTGYGVDSACLDASNNTPIMLFLMSCAQIFMSNRIKASSNSAHEDRLCFLYEKLLSSAQVDPFATKEALVHFNKFGQFFLLQFPGVVDHGGWNFYPISQRGLEYLIKQQEWELMWHESQLYTLCDPWHFIRSISRNGFYSPTCDNADKYSKINFSFWVVKPVEKVEELLDAKLYFLKCLLDYRQLHIAPGGRHGFTVAIHYLLQSSRVVIGILLVRYSKAGERPWIRHRFRKLALVRRWLVSTFQMLLEKGFKYISSTWLNHVGKHALEQHSRIYSAWIEAVGKVFPEFRDDSASPKGGSQKSGESVDGESQEQWETEGESETEENGDVLSDIGWETEEDWEETSMRNAEEKDQLDRVRIPHSKGCRRREKKTRNFKYRSVLCRGKQRKGVQKITGRRLTGRLSSAFNKVRSKPQMGKPADDVGQESDNDHYEEYWSQAYHWLSFAGSRFWDHEKETTPKMPVTGESKLWKVASTARDILSTVV
ncbi:hypothetical protein QBC44DRAFT_399064 [Cladorrhinum sp. PSN332]|nr:hypothetical protein QBC44DRAFT_399064 [Cladorrhinum sp. PSN332]